MQQLTQKYRKLKKLLKSGVEIILTDNYEGKHIGRVELVLRARGGTFNGWDHTHFEAATLSKALDIAIYKLENPESNYTDPKGIVWFSTVENGSGCYHIWHAKHVVKLLKPALLVKDPMKEK